MRKRWIAAALVAGSLIYGDVSDAVTSKASPLEDEPGWSCVDDGNRVCGPDNPEGKPAACYDDGGVIAAYWPCHVAIDPQTGDTDIFQDGNPIPVYVY